MNRPLKIITVLLILAFLLQPADPARADVAPPEPPNGAGPYPTTTTNVRMAAETVLIEVADDAYHAQVTADFTMHNMGNITETLEARFPLHDRGEGHYMECNNDFMSVAIYPSIDDLNIWVDGQPVSYWITYKPVGVVDALGQVTEIQVGCWANFQATFPPAKDVSIKVSYTTLPLISYAWHGYSYVLETGADWQGTIGSADIIVRAPDELNNYILGFCGTDSENECKVIGNLATWHAEDFEPKANFYVSLMQPSLWHKILAERENTARNPNDGEAWGRLGKAYKEAIMQRRGYRLSPAGLEMYQWSQAAYQKAVTLLPNDADWHYGYADLVCNYAIWEGWSYNVAEAWPVCFAELQRVLELNPTHEQANQLLKHLAFWHVVDLSGPTPRYILPTPRPTWRPELTATPNLSTPTQSIPASPTVTPLPPTPTPEITLGPVPIAIAGNALSTSPQPTTPPTPTLTFQSAETARDNQPVVPLAQVGAIILLALLVLAASRLFKR